MVLSPQDKVLALCSLHLRRASVVLELVCGLRVCGQALSLQVIIYKMLLTGWSTGGLYMGTPVVDRMVFSLAAELSMQCAVAFSPVTV